MSASFKPLFVTFLISFTLSIAAAQTPSAQTPSPQKDAAPPVVKSTAAPAELNGYKLAVWGMGKDEVKASLRSDFTRTEPNNSLADLPWELLHLANIAESDPDDLLGGDLEWYYGDRQDAVLGFYKDRFFFYAAGLDKILSASEYQQAIAARHGKSARTVAYQTTDPAAANAVMGSYTIEIWDKKKTEIILAVEKLFPGEAPEINYEIAYLSPDLFGEFKADFARALAEKTEAEKKQSDELLQEQKKNALEVLQ